MMIYERVDSGAWKPIRVTRGGMGISHLLFSDDILLFTEAKPFQMRVIMEMMKKFEELSGLAVNTDKSKVMFSRGVSKSTHEQISLISSISFAGQVGNYLGFSFFQGRVKKEDFNFIIDKSTSKLSGWKAKLLNKASRITLARSVLSSMPLYHM